MTGASDDRLRAAAAEVVALAAGRDPIGRTRVVGVEGRSGAGKTTFAELVADAVERADAQAASAPGSPARPRPVAEGAGARPPVLHLDDLYPGWEGLAAAPGIVAAALAPLRTGRPGTYRRWDWAHDRPGEHVTVEPTPWLVVEGVGCGARPVRPCLTALVWLEAPDGTRFERAISRDGDTYLPHWERWAAQEGALLAADEIRAHADLVVRTA